MDVSQWESARGGGFTWRQPRGLFVQRALPDGVELWSSLVVNAPHGLAEPGDETRHWFRAVFRLVEAPLPQATCRAAPYAYASLFPDGERGISSAGLDRITVGEHPAWQMEDGAHGYNGRYVFIELGPSRTAVLRFDTIGETLTERMRGPQRAIANQQGDIAAEVVRSLRAP